MLTVEFHDGFGRARRESARRVVVYDHHGNPQAAAVEYADFVITGTNDDPAAFAELLRSLGLLHATVVTALGQPREPLIRGT